MAALSPVLALLAGLVPPSGPASSHSPEVRNRPSKFGTPMHALGQRWTRNTAPGLAITAANTRAKRTAPAKPRRVGVGFVAQRTTSPQVAEAMLCTKVRVHSQTTSLPNLTRNPLAESGYDLKEYNIRRSRQHKARYPSPNRTQPAPQPAQPPRQEPRGRDRNRGGRGNGRDGRGRGRDNGRGRGGGNGKHGGSK